jgi:hypothetical protein
MAIFHCTMLRSLAELDGVLNHFLSPDGKLFPTHVENFWQRRGQG